MNGRRIRPKEWLPIGLSVAAFLLSIFSFYTTSLRVVDDVRVVVDAEQFAEPDFYKKQFEIRPTNGRFIFINAGARSAIISNISLSVAQRADTPAAMAGCYGRETSVVKYNVDPFVLRPGDMITKDALLVDTGEIKKEVNEDKQEAVIVPFSALNAKKRSVWFRLCTEIAYTTPSVEYGRATVSEFEDELNPDIIGYGFGGTEDGTFKEHRPVQLIKRSGIVFFD